MANVCKNVLGSYRFHIILTTITIIGKWLSLMQIATDKKRSPKSLIGLRSVTYK